MPEVIFPGPEGRLEGRYHPQKDRDAPIAIVLHPHVKDRLNQVSRIVIETQEPGVRIIDKTGPLHNPADRDHCLQYMVAVGLLHGRLTAEHYSDEAARDPRIDALRARMTTREDGRYSREYLEADKRSIANAVQVFFRDGTATRKVEVEYPLGHRRRRGEAVPHIFAKLEANLATRFAPDRVRALVALFRDRKRLEALPVPAFMDLFRP